MITIEGKHKGTKEDPIVLPVLDDAGYPVDDRKYSTLRITPNRVGDPDLWSVTARTPLGIAMSGLISKDFHSGHILAYADLWLTDDDGADEPILVRAKRYKYRSENGKLMESQETHTARFYAVAEEPEPVEETPAIDVEDPDVSSFVTIADLMDAGSAITPEEKTYQLTRREAFASILLEALIESPRYADFLISDAAGDAVRYADALIDALEGE